MGCGVGFGATKVFPAESGRLPRAAAGEAARTSKERNYIVQRLTEMAFSHDTDDSSLIVSVRKIGDSRATTRRSLLNATARAGREGTRNDRGDFL